MLRNIKRSGSPLTPYKNDITYDVRESTPDLVSYGEEYGSWDEHRAAADIVQEIYYQSQIFENYAIRMSECSGVLRFQWTSTDEGNRLVFREAHFCRVRFCPVCQWRRALMWRAKLYQVLPTLVEAYPRARWIFLTLTIKNCPVGDLHKTLGVMSKAWHRLTQRKEFKAVQGWIRTTEVTRGADGTAHPHYHCLMMVPPGYFAGRNYVSQRRWTEMWKECLRVDYTPVVHVRVVRPKNGDITKDHGIRDGIMETLKYTTKVSDMVQDPEWFVEMTKQVFKKRFIATGGVLKGFFTVPRALDGDNEVEDDGKRMAFRWYRNLKHYKRHPGMDVK